MAPDHKKTITIVSDHTTTPHLCVRDLCVKKIGLHVVYYVIILALFSKTLSLS